MLRSLSPECRMVFLTAGPDATVVSSLVRGPVDWARVLHLAEKELAGAALWRALEAAGAPVPDGVAATLRRHAMVSDFRMLHLAERLRRTLRAFAEHRVPVMLLKGAALGALTDQSFRSRPMNDLDLLVRRDDVGRARAAIHAAGWPANEDPLLRDLLRDHHHLPPFFDAQIPDLRLELHVALMPAGHAFTLDEERLWDEARRAPASFGDALVPSPEHLLLHACMHFAWSHTMQFGAWRTFRLASALQEAGLVDWRRFVALATRTGACSSAYWSLHLARELSGASVPDAALTPLASPPQQWLRDALARYFVAGIVPGEAPASPSLGVSRFLWRLAMRPAGMAALPMGDDGNDARWARGGARPAPQSAPQRALRHLRRLRHWWDFARHTLAALD